MGIFTETTPTCMVWLFLLCLRKIQVNGLLMRRKSEILEGNLFQTSCIKILFICFDRFFNHSCKPNAITIALQEHGMIIPRMCIFALRNIYPGENIT